MPNSSKSRVSLELPEDLKIIYDQIKITDRNVLALHALLDLLNRPDDQRETLGERLATLLQNLTEAHAQYQAQLEVMTLAMQAMQNQMKVTTEAERNHQRAVEKKLNRTLSLLGLPLD